MEIQKVKIWLIQEEKVPIFLFLPVRSMVGLRNKLFHIGTAVHIYF